jgi:hypothetical protein
MARPDPYLSRLVISVLRGFFPQKERGVEVQVHPPISEESQREIDIHRIGGPRSSLRSDHTTLQL